MYLVKKLKLIVGCVEMFSLQVFLIHVKRGRVAVDRKSFICEAALTKACSL